MKLATRMLAALRPLLPSVPHAGSFQRALALLALSAACSTSMSIPNPNDWRPPGDIATSVLVAYQNGTQVSIHLVDNTGRSFDLMELSVAAGEIVVGIIANHEGTAAIVTTHVIDGGIARGERYLVNFETDESLGLHSHAEVAGGDACFYFDLFSRVRWSVTGDILIECVDQFVRTTTDGDTSVVPFRYIGEVNDGRVLVGDEAGSLFFVSDEGAPLESVASTGRELHSWAAPGIIELEVDYMEAVAIVEVRWRDLDGSTSELIVGQRDSYTLLSNPSPNASFFVFQSLDSRTPGTLELWSRSGQSDLPLDLASSCTPGHLGTPQMTWSAAGDALVRCQEGIWELSANGDVQRFDLSQRYYKMDYNQLSDLVLLEDEGGWQVLDTGSGEVTELALEGEPAAVHWASSVWLPSCLTAACW